MTKSLIPNLSVIVLNYNSASYLADCLKSLYSSHLESYHLEIIVADNASTDTSLAQARDLKLSHPKITITYLPFTDNYGFAAGNNRALQKSHPQSPYLLFLNPDTTVEKTTLTTMLDFFNQNPRVDAATCHITLALTGQLQPESHRGFPTPWNTFWHFFGLGIPRLFPKSALFHGYLMDHLDYSRVQKIDCAVGAFLMVKRSVGETIGWWNEKYFFYGEDLDFCFKLRQHNFNLYFNPAARITHYQGLTSGLISSSRKISTASRETKIRSARESTLAMKTFIKENLLTSYPLPLRWLLLAGINLLAVKRYLKARYF